MSLRRRGSSALEQRARALAAANPGTFIPRILPRALAPSG